MARKIELDFYDKTYVIEYNRASVKEIFLKDSKDEIEQVISLIKGGLLLHHKNDMPSDEEILGWIIALGSDLEDFAKESGFNVLGRLPIVSENAKKVDEGKVESIVLDEMEAIVDNIIKE